VRDQRGMRVAAAHPAKLMGAQSQSKGVEWPQKSPRPCREMQKGETSRESHQIQQRIPAPSRQFTAYRHCDPFDQVYLDMACVDGNGDGKPDHPSGPGTYGHAM
jgi:hypothetical protein